ncbi:MAG: VWA domain-containing protein [Clostridia bacterium]|nr:VWA domain-containing protein [Clostridia bacterium]
MKIVDLKELALKKVKITGDVIGKFGMFEIEQIYKNTTKDILEVAYTFPIVETATVVGFEINVGDKVLKGICKEEGEAKKEYQKNIVKGNSAYLMEQETDNIFRISIGKIDKNEEVRVKIKYIDKFEIVDNTIKILLPTLVTPKYKSKITSNLSYGKVDYTVDFNISINKAVNRKSIYCPSHKINIIDENKEERIEVLDYDLSKDFKLDIELKNELLSNALISKTKDGKEIIYLSFMPEILDSYEDSEKEYLFIVDISGSMEGEKIEETKRAVIECLKQLDEGDKFNIIPFESRFEAMSINSIEYNENNLNEAIEYVKKLKVKGGTEILNPIKFALYEKDTEKIILLFTDGQVGNENEIINYIENSINRSRIFPFGIDSNVNSAFIKQLAKVGNGKAELIRPKEKIDDKIIRTFARIQTPLLEKIEIDYGKNKLIDEIREDKSLFNYEFFNVFSKVEKLEDDIKLKGKILDKQYEWVISKENIDNTNVDLELIFAKQEIERLEEYIRNTDESEKIYNYKKMIVEISEKYNINSKYTSFITIYERENKIVEVPKYQETTLSSGFIKGGLMDKLVNLFDADEDIDYEEDIADVPPVSYSKACMEPSDVEIPMFLRRSSNKKDEEYEEAIHKESNIEKLRKMVEEYYKTFINNSEKPIITYILYALYYLQNENIIFNYNEFINYLNKQKETIQNDELCMKLLYLCFEKLDNNHFFDKKDTADLLNKNYIKIAYTNLRINIKLKKLTKSEIEEIIKNGNVEEKINDILMHLCDENYGLIPTWLRG